MDILFPILFLIAAVTVFILVMSVKNLPQPEVIYDSTSNKSETPVTECELKAISTAPRVTEKQLEENIVAVNYLNVGDAICRVGQPDHASHHLLTYCVIVLRNGFTVTGESACASPDNYNEGIGQRIAYENAKNKIWALMGYALKENLALQAEVSKMDPDGDGRIGGSLKKKAA